MKLSKFKIENFKSIKSEVFDLNNFTLLVGANDHGKSNIMKAINAFFNTQFDEDGVLCEKGFYRNNKRRDSGSSPLRLSAVIDGLPAGLLHTKRKHKQVALSLQFFADDTVRVYFNSLDLDKPKKAHNNAANEKLLGIRKGFKVSYIPTFRNIEAELNPFSEKSILFELLSSYLVDALEKQQGGTTYEYRKIKRLKSDIDQLLESSFHEIKESARRYLPSSLGQTDFSLKFIHEETEDMRDLALSKILSKNTRVINSATGARISELGSGIQQAVTIGLIEKTCLPKNSSNLVLLEEPETFLHPNAQRELFVNLSGLSKRPSTQLVFSTHSSAILDATELANICVVRKVRDFNDADRTSKLLQMQSAHGVFAKKIIDEVELRKTFDNSDVFFSELVIFVEGFSDELILKEALKKIYPNLMYRVSIVNCHGNSKFLTMTKFLDSFRSRSDIQIDWAVIADKDSLIRDVLKDLKQFPSKDTIDWNDVVKTAKKEISTKDIDGNFSRNSTKLISNKINKQLQKARLYVLEADIEYALVSEKGIAKAHSQIKHFHERGEATLKNFSSLDKLANLLGSKGPNMNWGLDEDNRRRWKRAELHRAIAASYSASEFSEEIHRLVDWIKSRLRRH